MDRYAEREKEFRNLVQRIKEDIKAVYFEKGYYAGQIVRFIYTSKPTDFTYVYVCQGTLYFRDNDGYDLHSDNVNDITSLLEILRAMYHLPPNER
jgi:hypothetical protein